MSTRLNKHLALILGISRRQADEYISAKRVTVNGTAAILGGRVEDSDLVAVDGQVLAENRPFQYVLVNKPVGYVCSRKSQGAPTVYELLPSDLKDLKTVGRLDKDSSGLIILTNDGDFSFEMTHPKFYKTKVYKIRLDRNLEPLHQQMISDHGVTLDDGLSKLMLERLSETNRKEWTVTMSEGRNRQIRRTFSALGYTVTQLHRTNFGSYSLDDIKPGEFKLLAQA